MVRLITSLFAVLLIISCNTPESTNQPSSPTPEPATQVKEADEVRQLDKTMWFTTEASENLEKALGLTGLTDQAKQTNLQLEGKQELGYSTCKAWFGPGALAFYGEAGNIVKIRVDWAVETAHSRIEYYLENGKVYLMDLINADFGNAPEAKDAWMHKDPMPKAVKMVEGRYFFKNGEIQQVISREWLVGEETPAFGKIELPKDKITVLNSSIEGDLKHLLEFQAGKMDCEALIAAGYYP